MTTDELIDYYKNLLIIQYRNKPKAQGTVGAFVREIVSDQMISQVRDAFDLDSAVGEQLHVLGKYRGTPEVVYNFDPLKNFFALVPVADANPASYKGFALTTQSENQIDWFFLSPSDIAAVAYTLNDAEFRTLTKFRAAVHSSSLGVEEIDLILQSFFGNHVTLIDNMNMTATYNNSASNPDPMFKITSSSNSLPKPAGVQILVTNV